MSAAPVARTFTCPRCGSHFQGRPLRAQARCPHCGAHQAVDPRAVGGKWVVLDGQNNGTWWRGDVPLSAAEVRAAREEGASDALRFVRGPSPWMSKEPEEKARATWVGYFEHLAFRFRNAQALPDDARGPVDLLSPGERYELLFQGTIPPRRAQTRSVELVYPTMNRVHVDLEARPPVGGRVLRLHFANSAPFFDRYRIVNGRGAAIETKASSWNWQLDPGRNVLEVAAVNALGAPGRSSRLEVHYHPPRAP